MEWKAEDQCFFPEGIVETLLFEQGMYQFAESGSVESPPDKHLADHRGEKCLLQGNPSGFERKTHRHPSAKLRSTHRKWAMDTNKPVGGLLGSR